MDILQFLDELGTDIDSSFDYINSGGCCVYSSIVGKELINRNFDVKFAVSDSMFEEGTNLNKTRKQVTNNSIKEWNNNGIYFGHVFIELHYKNKKYFWDSSGISKSAKQDPTCGLPVIPGRLNLEEVISLSRSSNGEGWNKRFKRTQIPHMRRMIKKAFSGETFI